MVDRSDAPSAFFIAETQAPVPPVKAGQPAILDGAASRGAASSQPFNSALWLTAKRGRFEVGPAAYTRPRENEIVVRNHAIAINPLDWLTQSLGDLFLPWIKYPFIAGSDVAGEVVEVGSGVSRFKVGDRVLGHAVGAD